MVSNVGRLLQMNGNLVETYTSMRTINALKGISINGSLVETYITLKGNLVVANGQGTGSGEEGVV